MKRHIKVWGSRIVILVILVIAVQRWGMPVYNQYFHPKKKAAFVPTAKARQGAFTVSFHEIGNLDADKSVPVISEIEGKILKLVNDGTMVKAGDRIALLDTESLERDVLAKSLAYQNAMADVDRAKAELSLLKESNKTDVEQSEAQLGFDQSELDRAKNELERETRLADDKLVPRGEVEKASFDVRSKDLNVLKNTKALTLKRKEVESKEQQKQAEVRTVEFRANMAKMELDRAQAQMKSARVTAPNAGLVVISRTWTNDGRRKLQEGDTVNPQQLICSLPDLTTMQVKVKVGEADAPKIVVGLPVQLRLEAVPKKVFHGKVAEISTLATEASPWEGNATPGRKSFEVIIAIKEVDPKNLKPGMTADVEFICEQIKSAVYVPLEAVNEQDGKTFCFVQNGKRYDRVSVKTGKRNDNTICVINGIKAGQTVTLRDPTRPLDEQETGASESQQESGKKTGTAAPLPSSGKKK